MKKRNVFDRLVEDQDFYVRVQKTKVKVLAVLVAIVCYNVWR